MAPPAHDPLSYVILDNDSPFDQRVGRTRLGRPLVGTDSKYDRCATIDCTAPRTGKRGSKRSPGVAAATTSSGPKQRKATGASSTTRTKSPGKARPPASSGPTTSPSHQTIATARRASGVYQTVDLSTVPGIQRCVHEALVRLSAWNAGYAGPMADPLETHAFVALERLEAALGGLGGLTERVRHLVALMAPPPMPPAPAAVAGTPPLATAWPQPHKAPIWPSMYQHGAANSPLLSQPQQHRPRPLLQHPGVPPAVPEGFEEEAEAVGGEEEEWAGSDTSEAAEAERPSSAASSQRHGSDRFSLTSGLLTTRGPGSVSVRSQFSGNAGGMDSKTAAAAAAAAEAAAALEAGAMATPPGARTPVARTGAVGGDANAEWPSGTFRVWATAAEAAVGSGYPSQSEGHAFAPTPAVASAPDPAALAAAASAPAGPGVAPEGVHHDWQGARLAQGVAGAAAAAVASAPPVLMVGSAPLAVPDMARVPPAASAPAPVEALAPGGNAAGPGGASGAATVPEGGATESVESLFFGARAAAAVAAAAAASAAATTSAVGVAAGISIAATQPEPPQPYGRYTPEAVQKQDGGFDEEEQEQHHGLAEQEQESEEGQWKWQEDAEYAASQRQVQRWHAEEVHERGEADEQGDHEGAQAAAQQVAEQHAQPHMDPAGSDGSDDERLAVAAYQSVNNDDEIGANDAAGSAGSAGDADDTGAPDGAGDADDAASSASSQQHQRILDAACQVLTENQALRALANMLAAERDEAQWQRAELKARLVEAQLAHNEAAAVAAAAAAESARAGAMVSGGGAAAGGGEGGGAGGALQQGVMETTLFLGGAGEVRGAVGGGGVHVLEVVVRSEVGGVRGEESGSSRSSSSRSSVSRSSTSTRSSKSSASSVRTSSSVGSKSSRRSAGA